MVADWVDWEQVYIANDPEAIAHAQSSMVRRMADAHKGELMRLTIVEDRVRDEVWLCLEGWEKKPDDQGPEPTAADIPVGFA